MQREADLGSVVEILVLFSEAGVGRVEPAGELLHFAVPDGGGFVAAHVGPLHHSAAAVGDADEVNLIAALPHFEQRAEAHELVVLMRHHRYYVHCRTSTSTVADSVSFGPMTPRTSLRRSVGALVGSTPMQETPRRPRLYQNPPPGRVGFDGERGIAVDQIDSARGRQKELPTPARFRGR